ncbi:hypothetical protein TEA_008628 [Camellia sinensis var. sinensis]|uniref:Secreted protein n=1 Tax=Camellia sinensis var. sinensis TaxID=542762 RepID=A0A4S4ELY8_CAMSN|nr:hypothetical protein TEA_008628 [Camellia sinensis var. sinensis]
MLFLQNVMYCLILILPIAMPVHEDVTKKPAEETPEITPTVDEAVLSPVNQDTITPLPSESDTMEPKEMLLSDEEKERNSAEEEKLEESPIDEEAAHNSSVEAAFGATEFTEDDDEDNDED